MTGLGRWVSFAHLGGAVLAIHHRAAEKRHEKKKDIVFHMERPTYTMHMQLVPEPPATPLPTTSDGAVTIEDDPTPVAEFPTGAMCGGLVLDGHMMVKPELDGTTGSLRTTANALLAQYRTAAGPQIHLSSGPVDQGAIASINAELVTNAANFIPDGSSSVPTHLHGMGTDSTTASAVAGTTTGFNQEYVTKKTVAALAGKKTTAASPPISRFVILNCDKSEVLYNVLSTSKNADGSGGPSFNYDIYDAQFRALVATGRESATVPGMLVFALDGNEIARTQTPLLNTNSTLAPDSGLLPFELLFSPSSNNELHIVANRWIISLVVVMRSFILSERAPNALQNSLGESGYRTLGLVATIVLLTTAVGVWFGTLISLYKTVYPGKERGMWGARGMVLEEN
ncbi:unnamed protein product [Amoebophrya sp. A120]|nr:unnamed protein product [Amoebophrya sp. A120]|eukprot:GSA120T00003441001.1